MFFDGCVIVLLRCLIVLVVDFVALLFVFDCYVLWFGSGL